MRTEGSKYNGFRSVVVLWQDGTQVDQALEIARKLEAVA